MNRNNSMTFSQGKEVVQIKLKISAKKSIN